MIERALNIKLTDTDLAALMAKWDTDGDGCINYRAFQHHVANRKAKASTSQVHCPSRCQRMDCTGAGTY